MIRTIAAWKKYVKILTIINLKKKFKDKLDNKININNYFWNAFYNEYLFLTWKDNFC